MKKNFSADQLARSPTPKIGSVTDHYGRDNAAKTLAKLIVTGPAPYVYSIEGPFGSGKTHYILQIIAHLETSELIKQASKVRHVIFDAWRTDHQTLALVALVSKILSAYPENNIKFKQKLDTGVKEIVRAYKRSSVAVGAGIAGTNINVDFEDSPLKAFQKTEDEISYLRKDISALIGASREKLVVFIDDMDRCRPSYAIEIMECIKHILDIPNLVFVICIDKSQIESIIGTVFGSSANSNGYLARFIDLRTQLPPPSPDHSISELSLYKTLGKGTEKTDFSSQYRDFIKLSDFISESLDLSIRDIDHISRFLCILPDKGHYDQTILYGVFFFLSSIFYARREVFDRFTVEKNIDILFSEIENSARTTTGDLLRLIMSFLDSIPCETSGNSGKNFKSFCQKHNFSTGTHNTNYMYGSIEKYIENLVSFREIMI